MKSFAVWNFFIVVLVLSNIAVSSSSRTKSGSSRTKTGSSSSGGSQKGSSGGSNTGSGKTNRHGGQSEHDSGMSRQPPYNPNFSRSPTQSSYPHYSAPSNPLMNHYPISAPGNSHPSMPYPNGQNPRPPGWSIPQPGSHYPAPPFPPSNYGHNNPSAPQMGPISYPTGSFQSHGTPHGASYPMGGSHSQSQNQPINVHHHYAPTYHSAPPTQAFVPGRTVYVDKTSKGPGLGTYIGSAVAGGVAAGATNAIVEQAISSIFRPSSNHVHTYPIAPVVGTPTSTHTVNNYYYGNSEAGGPPSSNNNNQQNQESNAATSATNADKKEGSLPMTNGIVSRTPEAVAQAEKDDPISDTNIMKLTEELFDAQDKNLYPLVELNLQKLVTPSSNPSEKVPDEASQNLFTLKPELDSIGTVRSLRALYDNYEKDGFKPENLTVERENEEKTFIDELMKTPVMTRAMNWLVGQKYIEPRESEKKDTLRRMWFSTYDNTSSGFERVFLSEKYGTSGIFGLQNWLYFAHLESQNTVNYLGYVGNANLSGKGQLLKLNYLTEGFTIQNATIFVGTPPELEVALYTICFYARPNNWCPVSLGGTKFFVLTRLFKYFQKDLIDLAFPLF